MFTVAKCHVEYFDPMIRVDWLCCWCLTIIKQRRFIPDPDVEFLPIPDPGVKKASADPGSGTATTDAD
jgi:hypothetical protein